MDSASQCLLFRDTLRLANTIENNEPRLISALGISGWLPWLGCSHEKLRRSVLSLLAHSDETNYHRRLQPPRSTVASAGFLCSSTSPSRISGVRVGS